MEVHGCLRGQGLPESFQEGREAFGEIQGKRQWKEVQEVQEQGTFL